MKSAVQQTHFSWARLSISRDILVALGVLEKGGPATYRNLGLEGLEAKLTALQKHEVYLPRSYDTASADVEELIPDASSDGKDSASSKDQQAKSASDLVPWRPEMSEGRKLRENLLRLLLTTVFLRT